MLRIALLRVFTPTDNARVGVLAALLYALCEESAALVYFYGDDTNAHRKSKCGLEGPCWAVNLLNFTY